jgi:FMNH2-dependent dimethyl sulfone monooxygenase
VGTPEQVAERIAEFEDAGADLLLLQFSPQLEEMERFSRQVIRGNRAPAQSVDDFASRELRRAAIS